MLPCYHDEARVVFVTRAARRAAAEAAGGAAAVG